MFVPTWSKHNTSFSTQGTIGGAILLWVTRGNCLTVGAPVVGTVGKNMVLRLALEASKDESDWSGGVINIDRMRSRSRLNDHIQSSCWKRRGCPVSILEVPLCLCLLPLHGAVVVPAQYHFLWEILLLACGQVVNGLEYLANWGLARVVVEELELQGGGSECE